MIIILNASYNMFHIILATLTTLIEIRFEGKSGLFFKQIFDNLFKSVFYAISVCIGVFICTRYSKMKKHYGTNQSPANVMTTNHQVTTVQMANPQTIQTVMINGQLMQVVTPANRIAAQPTVVTTGNIAGNQPQMLIVQNPNNQQVVQAAAQPSVQPVAQTVVQQAPIVPGQNDLPPAYQV